MSSHRLRAGFALALLVALCATSVPAAADILVTTSGKQWKGTVTEDGDGYLLAMENGARMRFPKSMVKEVIREDAPAAEEAGQDETPAAGSGASADDAATGDGNVSYVLIPIEGMIGADVVWEGMEQCLKSAERRAGHVILVVDAAGGLLEDAERICDAMERYGNSITFHAVVKRAAGSALWPVFACQSVHLVPGATLGGDDEDGYLPEQAQQRHDDHERMADAARKLSRIARRNNHPDKLVDALVPSSMNVFIWKTDDATVVVGEELPDDVEESQVVFRPDQATLPSLSSEAAVAAGLGKQIPSPDPAALAQALGIEAWSPILEDIVEKTLERTKARRAHERLEEERKAEQRLKEAEALAEKSHQLAMSILVQVKVAEDASPHNGSYVYNAGDMEFTTSSQRQWQKRTDDAISKWKQVIKGTQALQEMDKKIIALGGEPRMHDFDPVGLAARAADEIRRLKVERDTKTRP